jgi:hypothetical protein
MASAANGRRSSRYGTGERRAIAALERQLAMAKQAAGELVSRTGAYVADQVRAAAVDAGSDIEQRVSSAAAAVRSDAMAAARHRNLAFVFMMASALASALALSALVSTWGRIEPRDLGAAAVPHVARVSDGAGRSP